MKVHVEEKERHSELQWRGKRPYIRQMHVR